MTTTRDHRETAREHLRELLELLRSQPDQAVLRPLIDECESLERAIAAFHLEAIRFRMFNVDRLLTRGHLPLPRAVSPLFADVRRELEAAGFHTRSHQAPS